MKAAIRTLISLDLTPAEEWTPDDVVWARGLRLTAGPDDGPGEESFDFTVCSLAWVAERILQDGLFDGRHHLIVDDYDWSRIRAVVDRYVGECEGESWFQVAQKLGRFAYWEFEDFHGS